MARAQRVRYRLAGAVCVIALYGALTSAHAELLAPLRANVTVLGPATIVTYYTARPDGLAFVATAQVGEDGSGVPLRFAETLLPT